jgi:hypothetical protein
MTAAELVSVARLAGLELAAVAGKLRLRGPKQAAPLMKELTARKAEVLGVLSIEPLDHAHDEPHESEDIHCRVIQRLSGKRELVFEEDLNLMRLDEGTLQLYPLTTLDGPPPFRPPPLGATVYTVDRRFRPCAAAETWQWTWSKGQERAPAWYRVEEYALPDLVFCTLWPWCQ